MTRLYSSTYKYRFKKNKRNIEFSCGTNPGKAARYHKAVQVVSDKVPCRICGIGLIFKIKILKHAITQFWLVE